MTETFPDPESISALRQVIGNFLQERLQLKLNKLKDDDVDERQQLLKDYQAEDWIADAARRVAWIQQVTHAIKFTHPDAKGSNLNSLGQAQAGDVLIGTHTIAATCIPDVVGNAAALDVYKFLRLSVNGRPLLDRAIAGDTVLQAAFSANAELASSWMEAFAGLVQPTGKPSSHKLAKQIYWPLDDGSYHLLAPLFPTSLVHGVRASIREDRFSDAAKAAREARRTGASHPHGYREYPNLAIQNFGGTKPQNISQLNSERYGENFLLPSLPPTWRSDPVRPPLRMESVFDRLFGSRQRVKELTRNLREFLTRVAEVNNIGVREARASMVEDIRDELFQFTAELYELAPGWTRHQDCRLNIDEQCWLDHDRAASDEAFAAAVRSADWQEGICRRFGNWLNARLTNPKMPMGQAEADEWKSVLDKELRMVRLEIEDHD